MLLLYDWREGRQLVVEIHEWGEDTLREGMRQSGERV